MQTVKPMAWSWLLPGASGRRARLAGVLFVGALGLGAASPLGPFALDRADVLRARGEHEAAYAQLERVARWHPSSSVRAAAHERAARVAQLRLQSPDAARAHLEALVGLQDGDRAAQAATWHALADLLERDLGDLDDAAAAWRMAYDLDPLAEAAAERLARAARSLESAGRPDDALAAWERLARRVPGEAARAQLSLAALSLAEGDVRRAYDAYREAARRTDDPDLLRVARMGTSACAERLGEPEAAVADLGVGETDEP